MQIDKIYIISLEALKPEKIQDLFQRLHKFELPPGIPYEIVPAYNGKLHPLPMDIAPYSGWNLGPEVENDWWNRDMLPGEVGCAISHYWVYNRIARDGVNTALILEEDFWPVKTYAELKLDLLPESCDIAILGRNRFYEDEMPYIDHWVLPKMFYNSHAYILTNNGAQKILNYPDINKNLIPIDELLVAIQMEHPRNDIRKMYPPVILGLATKDDFIVQNRFGEPSTIMEDIVIEPKDEPIQKPYFEILDDSDWDLWKAKYLNHTIAKGEFDLMVDDLGNNIFEFQLFTDKFCREAIALAETMDKWTLDRHEFYPTNDVLLDEIGLDRIYNRVIEDVISPLCIHLWHLEGEGWQPLKSENFLARYTTDRQSHLALHHDFSHISMVVKLNDEFEGGGTWFPKYKVLSNPKRNGMATLHPGLVTHLHGARPIYSGKRYICVSFMKNNKISI